jgi:hypothetical protein
MDSSTWIGFGISGPLTRTQLHFMPLARGIGAPYPVNFSLTTGGGHLPSRTLNIEGARLGQADGFRLEEAHPALAQQGPGLYYAKLVLSPAAHKLDLKPSAFHIDLQYQQSRVKYEPKLCNLAHPNAKKSNHSSSEVAAICEGIALRDPNLYPMLTLINTAAYAIEVKVFSYSSMEFVSSLVLAPDSVREFELTELNLNNNHKLESASGALEAEAFQIYFEYPASIHLEQRMGAAVAAFLVYRDRNTRRISSVLKL